MFYKVFRIILVKLIRRNVKHSVKCVPVELNGTKMTSTVVVLFVKGTRASPPTSQNRVSGRN